MNDKRFINKIILTVFGLTILVCLAPILNAIAHLLGK